MLVAALREEEGVARLVLDHRGERLQRRKRIAQPTTGFSGVGGMPADIMPYLAWI